MPTITPPVAPAAGPDPVVTAASNLPQPLTPFVGRRRELEEAERLVIPSRLLTLCGAGGSGKTRLALELARVTGERCGVQVAWADFSSLADPALVPQVVGEALGMRDEGTGVETDAVVACLRGRTILLVLDNCEHVVDMAASLASTLLRECPGLGILATSREPLAIAGEQAWLVPPMTLPHPAASAADAERDSEAIQLFVTRARDVLPSFTLTDANVAAVAEICRRLDGIPLAIELAAARVRALGPEQIARRLDDVFGLLTGGGRNALPRHRTLRATMEWSVRLLAPDAQALLRRLGVFSGGFTLEAVEAVCVGGDVGDDAVLDLLTQLVDRSLVVAREQATTARYHLLETVRQYALERLVDAGEDGSLRAAHARHVAGEVAVWEPRLLTADRPAAMQRLDVEVDNIRQALRWTRNHDPDAHVQLAGSLCWYWFSSRHWSEGRRWMEEALGTPAAAKPGAGRGALLFAVGVMATMQGDAARAIEAEREAVALAVARGDRAAEAWANVFLGHAIAVSGGGEGKELSERAGAWFRASGDRYGVFCAELIQGAYAIATGDPAGALRHAEESVRIAEEFGLDREIAIAKQSLSHALFDLGEVARGTRLAQESIEALRRDPSLLFLARCLELVAMGACDQGRWEDGVTLFAAAMPLRKAIGAQLFQIDTARYAPRLARARAALGESAFQVVESAGGALSMDAALARALAVPAEAAKPATADTAAAAPGAPGAFLHLRVLGPLEIHLDGRLLPPDVWRSARPRELFLYLALHPEGRTREQIGLAFWPDASAAQVRNSFHVTLHHVRKALGRTDAVIIDRDRYRLAPTLGAWCDAVVFPRRVQEAMRLAKTGTDARAALTDALALYRGHLFEGLATGDWHLDTDGHLRKLAADGCWALARAHLAAGDVDAAVPVLERLVRLDDLREEAHRALMEACVASGARGRAIAHYRDFVARLKREFQAEPEAETTALYARILRAQGPLG